MNKYSIFSAQMEKGAVVCGMIPIVVSVLQGAFRRSCGEECVED